MHEPLLESLASVPSPPLLSPPSSATEIFRGLLGILYDLDARYRAVGDRMVALAEGFRKEFPRTRLRLCPWRRRKGALPYALYWVVLCRNRQPRLPLDRPGSLDAHLDSKRPTWSKYVKRLTRFVIHYAGGSLSRHRHLIRRFDRDRASLNRSLSLVARVRRRIRMTLLFGYPSRRVSPSAEAPPRAIIPESLLHDKHLVALGAWRLARAIVAAQSDLRALVSRQNANPPSPRLRLIFARDRDHPYGRVKWYDSFGRRSFSSLTKAKKRLLSIPRHLHPPLTPFERDRRRLLRVYLKHVGVLRRVSTLASPPSFTARPGVPPPPATGSLHEPSHPATLSPSTTASGEAS